MLRSLFGNSTVEKVLYYLRRNREGYARGMSTQLGISVGQLQQQLRRLEQGQIVVSRKVGVTRLWEISPRWPFKKYLDALLDAAMDVMEPDVLAEKFTVRKRPRRAGKP